MFKLLQNAFGRKGTSYETKNPEGDFIVQHIIRNICDQWPATFAALTRKHICLHIFYVNK